MKSITFITGGARSGKSTFAEKLAADNFSKVMYIATAIPFDEEMKDRIKRHKERRPENWITFEGYKNLHEVFDNKEFDIILLDCITIMVSNFLYEQIGDNIEILHQKEIDFIEKDILQEITSLLDTAEKNSKPIILVSNEVGFGIVPEYKLGRVYRDIAGRVNQYIAQRSQEVYLIVSGIPVKIK